MSLPPSQIVEHYTHEARAFRDSAIAFMHRHPDVTHVIVQKLDDDLSP